MSPTGGLCNDCSALQLSLSDGYWEYAYCASAGKLRFTDPGESAGPQLELLSV